jgi:predicted O-linked N-acetylglucosamine transferase (SPINDLY family)
MPLNISNEEETFQAAVAAQRGGRLAEAQQHYLQVLRMNPTRGPAYHNLGVLAFQVGQFEQSLKLLEKARECGFATPGVFCSTGDACTALRQYEDALSWYEKAIALDPDTPTAYNNAGAVLLRLGRLGEAVAAWEEVVALARKAAETAGPESPRAVALKSFAAAAFNNLGEAYLERGLLPLAREKHQQAIDTNPHFPVAHSNLLRGLLYGPDLPPAEMLAAHKQWWRTHTSAIQPLGAVRDKNPDRKLRVGFLSPNFAEHALAHFMLPLFEHHDRDQLEFFAYANVRMPDDVTLKFVAHCEGGWRNIVGLTDESIARLVNEDRIDILVDLVGHMADNRLAVFAYRPAPVQVSYLGYPATTGSPFIDYRLVDPVADPAGLTEAAYTEKLWRLPRTGWCYRPPAEMERVDVPVVPPVERGGNRHFTFGGFAAAPRLSDQTVRLWAGAMQAVENSRLILKAAPLTDKGTRRGLRERFAGLGIDAERLTFLGNQPELAEHLSWYRKVDVALDTVPYEGLAQTCDALWLGVPVISMAGQTSASRTGAALLTHLGLEKLVANSENGYIRRAAQLAKDHQVLATLRKALRKRMSRSPLRDEEGFAADVGAAFRGMWQAWCKGK